MADEWREMPFSQAVEINPAVPLVRGASYPFVDMAAVEATARCVFAGEERIFDGSGSRFVVGDTLMARITPCLENGKIARFCGSDGQAGFGSTEFIVIRGRDGVSDSSYAYYLTMWERVRGYAISQMTGTSGRQRVPTAVFDHLIIPLPPLHEQRAIAHILGTLDDTIELNRRMSATLEALAQTLFTAWFVDFAPVRAKMDGRWRSGESLPGLPAALYDRFPDGLCDSEFGAIPEGWEATSLDRLATFVNGLALQNYPPRDHRSLPVIKIAQLRNGHTRGADRATADLDPRYVVSDGDILFSWSGSLECVVWAGGTGALNQHLFKVVPNGAPPWLCYFAIHRHLDDFRRIAAGKATTMGHIQRQHLTQARIALPPAATLAALDRIMAPLFERRWQCLCENRTIAAIRNALLPRLISGTLRVRDAERLLRERGL